MRVLIAAGGTGGHFYPGLAVACALIEKGHSCQFIVRTNDYVIPLLEREKIQFFTIPAAGLQRRLDPKNFLLPFKVVAGLFQSIRIIHEFRPDVVLVMGGYLSVAPAVAARVLNVPVVLHEQNMIPGLANRIISRLAKKVAVSFEASLQAFGNQAVLTGNPVRVDFKFLPAEIKSRLQWKLDPFKKTILIVGGSLGSESLNTLVLDAAKSITGRDEKIQFLHFTGKSDEERIKGLYAELHFGHTVMGYCHDMPAAYAAADLVIARAGASTISELMVVKKPAILIPFPAATNNHQLANANILSSLGAALVFEERHLGEGKLGATLQELLTHPLKLQALQAAYAGLRFDPFSAADAIVNLLQP